jgi:tetratricopeptide (TPR) repeat protein
MYLLLLAEFNYEAGDPQAGYRFMLEAAHRTGDEALYRRATEMAIHARAGTDALEMARAWHAALPASADASRYELQLLLALGRPTETEAPLHAILAALPAADREDFLAALPTLYARTADRAEAARIVEHALQDVLQDPKDPALAAAAWTAVGRLRLRAGDKAGALAAATLGQSADVASRWPPLLALQLVGSGEPQAQALVERHLQTPKPHPQVQLAWARWLSEQGRLADAHALLDAATARDPDFAQAWLLQGALYAQQRQDDQARQALESYIALLKLNAKSDSEGMDEAHLMLARIATRGGDAARAQALLDQIHSPDQAFAVANARAALLVKQGRLDDALAAIGAVPENDARDAQLKLLAQSQLLRDNGRAAQAYQLLAEQLQDDPDDEDLLYDCALSADRMGDPEKMESLLRRLIALKPDSFSALNALGYSLADRGVRLDEAKTLIEKAVQLSPDDAFIQDSLGWVHFRLGHLDEAARILTQAYARQPDPEIAAHLGEVLWAQGQTERARAIWAEGLRADPGNDTLQQTLKRLKVKLAP